MAHAQTHTNTRTHTHTHICISMHMHMHTGPVCLQQMLSLLAWIPNLPLTQTGEARFSGGRRVILNVPSSVAALKPSVKSSVLILG